MVDWIGRVNGEHRFLLGMGMAGGGGIDDLRMSEFEGMVEHGGGDRRGIKKATTKTNWELDIRASVDEKVGTRKRGEGRLLWIYMHSLNIFIYRIFWPCKTVRFSALG